MLAPFSFMGGAIDPDAQAFINAAGITNPVQINAINTLVEGMKTDGIWTKMKAIYPFVGGTASAHKWNLKDPRDLDAAFRLVFNGGWTHSANGATPNGTNGYADTKLVANSAMNFNSQSFSDYLGTNPAANTVCQFGSFGGNPFSGVSLFVRDGYNGMNDNILSPTMATSTQAGLFTLNRNNENTKKLFRNGSSIGSTSSTATNLSNGSIFIGTANVNSNPDYYSTAQHRFFSAGDGLTDTEAANLYTAVQAFQTSLNRQV